MFKFEAFRMADISNHSAGTPKDVLSRLPVVSWDCTSKYGSDHSGSDYKSCLDLGKDLK